MVLFTSCAPMVGASALQSPPTAALGEPFTLAAGQTAQVGPDRTSVTFDTVVSDSRCPTDVQCIRAGEAVVRVVVAAQGQAGDTVELQTTPTRNTAPAAGYTLALTRLLPEPATSAPLKLSDYRATFTLAKP